MAGEALAAWAGSAIGTAVIGGAATAAIGAGASALLAPHSHLSLPPPPGAAMIDPEGANAAANIRRQQAAAQGLNSTITGAGQSGQPSGPTAGSKSLLGQ